MNLEFKPNIKNSQYTFDLIFLLSDYNEKLMCIFDNF